MRVLVPQSHAEPPAGMLNGFDRKFSSTPTSLAPGTERKLRRFSPSKITSMHGMPVANGDVVLADKLDRLTEEGRRSRRASRVAGIVQERHTGLTGHVAGDFDERQIRAIRTFECLRLCRLAMGARRAWPEQPLRSRASSVRNGHDGIWHRVTLLTTRSPAN
jgi:hypothetical protein